MQSEMYLLIKEWNDRMHEYEMIDIIEFCGEEHLTMFLLDLQLDYPGGPAPEIMVKIVY